MIGALLGTQNGREVEIVNTFELAMEADGSTVDAGFLVTRRDQCTNGLYILLLFSPGLASQTSKSSPL